MIVPVPIALGDWTIDDDVLAPLINIVRDTFTSVGIHFYQDERGEWGMRVPLTPQTTPGN